MCYLQLGSFCGAAGLELAGISPAKCPAKSAENETVCALRTPKERLPSGVPKEEFGG